MWVNTAVFFRLSFFLLFFLRVLLFVGGVSAKIRRVKKRGSAAREKRRERERERESA